MVLLFDNTPHNESVSESRSMKQNSYLNMGNLWFWGQFYCHIKFYKFCVELAA